jgi:hypothetical protein
MGRHQGMMTKLKMCQTMLGKFQGCQKNEETLGDVGQC